VHRRKLRRRRCCLCSENLIRDCCRLLNILAVSSGVLHLFNGHNYMVVATKLLAVLLKALAWPVEFHGNSKNSFAANGTSSRLTSLSQAYFMKISY